MPASLRKTPTRKTLAPGRTAFDWSGFRADLRAAVPDATAALIATVLIFVWLYVRVRSGTSPTVEVMPFLADANRYWMYLLCQAFGWSGLLWAWLTTIFGLIRSGTGHRLLHISTARIERWHRTTSLTTIALMFLHAFMFFAELVRTNQYDEGAFGRLWSSFVEVFVPGGYPSGTGVVAILIGLLALYLAIPLGLLFYFRGRTGARLWRALHRFIIVVYVLSVWHTLLYGTNVWFDGWPRTTLWVLQVPIAALLLARLVRPARPAERFRRLATWLTVRKAGALVVVVVVLGTLVAVVISGRDGGRPPGPHGSHPLSVTPWMVWTATAVLALLVALVCYVVIRAERVARGSSMESSKPALTSETSTAS